MAICAELRRGESTVQITGKDDFLAIFKTPEVISKIGKIREATRLEEEYRTAGRIPESKEQKRIIGENKSSLPGMVFQCSSFKVHNWTDKKNVNHGDAAWRHQEHAILNGLFMVDIDHVEEPRKMWESFMANGLSNWEPFFAFVTPSGRGLKIVMPADVSKGNLASNQDAFARAFGIAVDEKTKDASRLSFVSTYDDILLFDERLLTYENEAFIKKYQDKYNDGSSDQDLFETRSEEGFSLKVEAGGLKENTEEAEKEAEKLEDWVKAQMALIRQKEVPEIIEEYEKKTYKGVKVLDLINAYFNGEAPAEGERHDALLKFASDLRHIVERIPKAVYYYCLKLPFVQDLAREGDPVVDTIHDALGYKYTSFLPKRFAVALKDANASKVSSLNDAVTADTIEERFREFGERFEEMFNYFPCMREACEGFRTPSIPAVIFATGCLYGTLATRTWWYHYHEPLYMRRLNYEIFIIADPASGKSGIGNLYKLILSPVIAKDKAYNDEINKYKFGRRDREFATKEEKKKPLIYPQSKVRIHGPRTANNIFIEDMVNNVEDVDGMPLHIHLFTFSAELDNASLASKGGQWIDKSGFELLAFHNEEDNQQYRNVDSVSGPFDVFWNFIYTGTPFSLYRKVTKANFGSGLSTRLAVIPLCAEKFKMLEYNKTTTRQQKSRETLKEWAYRINDVKGELKIETLVRLTYDWTDELMKIAGETQDDCLAFLIKRVSYYGINVAVPFIIMRHWDTFKESGELKIDEHDKDLVNLIMEIQLYSQKIYFGKFTEHYFAERSSDISEKAPSNINTKTVQQLAKLPSEFTHTDMEKVFDMTRNYARLLTHRWIVEGLITKRERSKKAAIFDKTEKGKNV